MLVLTRRIGESIIIAGNIEVKVLGVYRGFVKIGIAADESIPIKRGEKVDKERRREAEAK